MDIFASCIKLYNVYFWIYLDIVFLSKPSRIFYLNELIWLLTWTCRIQYYFNDKWTSVSKHLLGSQGALYPAKLWIQPSLFSLRIKSFANVVHNKSDRPAFLLQDAKNSRLPKKTNNLQHFGDSKVPKMCILYFVK